MQCTRRISLNQNHNNHWYIVDDSVEIITKILLSNVPFQVLAKEDSNSKQKTESNMKKAIMIFQYRERDRKSVLYNFQPCGVNEVK